MKENVTTARGPVLQIENLHVDYTVRGDRLPVLRGLDLTIGPGEAYGLVGESGCGKSTVALAAVRYLARNGCVRSGRVLINGVDVVKASPAELRSLRRDAVSMVYQDPGRALDPSMRVRHLMAEAFQSAGVAGRENLEKRSLEMLDIVRIASPARVMDAYAHQLSGGMQQRVIIAMALAKSPSLLVLDEPTTGLDATVEAEILDTIDALRKQLGMAVLFISHNLGVIGKMCDRVGVLYAGTLVEEGAARDALRNPGHPYTVGLIRCLPRPGLRKGDALLETVPGLLPPIGARLPGCVFAERCAIADSRCHAVVPAMLPLVPPGHTQGDASGAPHLGRCHFAGEAAAKLLAQPARAGVALPAVNRSAPPLLELQGISKTFTVGGQPISALYNVSFRLWPGETLGLVGESGSGKSTLAKVLMGLTSADPGGKIDLRGTPLADTPRKRSREQIKAVQMVFQNPAAALNRSRSVRQLVGRSITRLGGMRGKARAQRFLRLAAGVRLGERHFDVRQSQLSGGLKQRVAIARAFAGEPEMVICDEPTSALDVSVQAAILNLLVELQSQTRVSYLFISHDLPVVRYLADRIAVLYRGRIVQIGPAQSLFTEYRHPYTDMLLASMHDADHVSDELAALPPNNSSAIASQAGCIFEPRCPRHIDGVCDRAVPPSRTVSDHHVVECHLSIEDLRVDRFALASSV